MRLKLLFDCIEQMCDEFEDYLDRCLKSGVSEYELKSVLEISASSCRFWRERFLFRARQSAISDDFSDDTQVDIRSELAQQNYVKPHLLAALTAIFRISLLPKEVDR